MKIIYDHREDRSSIPALLDLAGVELESSQLAVGDYIISDQIVIERKSPQDLTSSIISGRLFEQVARMKEAYPVCILLSEGQPRGLPRTSWIGALTSAMRKGVIVLNVADEGESAEWITRFASQEDRGPSKPRGSGRKGKEPDAQAELMLAQIPGISITAAAKLLNHFGSLQALGEASSEELQEVEGIGKKRASEIAYLFHHPYGKKPF